MRFVHEKKRLTTVMMGVCGAFLLFGIIGIRAFCHNSKRLLTEKQRADLARVSGLISGSVVYQRESSNLLESIYRTDIGSTKTILLARDGRYPRWSPDGRRIAFLRKGAVMLMNRDGSDQIMLVPASEPRAIAWHPKGGEVLFASGESILAVDVATRAVREVISGRTFAGMDIDASGTRLLFSVRGRNVYAADLPGGDFRRITIGCSVSLSPDAELILHNNGGHRRLTVRQWSDGKPVRQIRAPDGFQVDNVKWSNHPDWIAVRTEGKGSENVFVYHISEDRYYQVTFCGDANRPDLFVSRTLSGYR